MASESIITATFGAPGSGKTYSRVRWLCTDFLVNNPSGLYITNIPVNVEAVSEYMSHILKCDKQQITERIVIIPDSELVMWEKLNQLENRDLNSFTSLSFPPAAYLQQYNLEGAHVAIDEFHKYFSKKGPKQLKKLWNDWFAEIRKTGCVFEAITQSYGQMCEDFLDKCTTRTELLNHADSRDPFLGCRMGDWYELRAGLLGTVPVQRVTEKETMRATSTSGRLMWQPVKVNTFVLDPEYFHLYNSFHNYTGVSGVRKSPAEIYGRRIVFWFFRRNWFNILPRVIGFCVVVWFLLFGGFNWAFSGIFKVFDLTGKKNMTTLVPPKTEQTVSPDKKNQAQKTGTIVPMARDHNAVDQNKSISGDADPAAAVKPSEDLTWYKPCLFFNDLVILRNGIEIFIGYKCNNKKGSFFIK